MRFLPSLADQKSNLLQSLGGGLFLIGMISLGLVLRDYVNVWGADATAATSEAFHQTSTLVSVAISALLVVVGGFLFWIGRKTHSRRHREHAHRVRTSRPSRPMPLVKPVTPPPAAVDDETVSLDSPQGVLANGDAGGDRVKRRIRVRVRLPDDKKKK